MSPVWKVNQLNPSIPTKENFLLLVPVETYIGYDGMILDKFNVHPDRPKSLGKKYGGELPTALKLCCQVLQVTIPIKGRCEYLHWQVSEWANQVKEEETAIVSRHLPWRWGLCFITWHKGNFLLPLIQFCTPNCFSHSHPDH